MIFNETIFQRVKRSIFLSAQKGHYSMGRKERLNKNYFVNAIRTLMSANGGMKTTILLTKARMNILKRKIS